MGEHQVAVAVQNQGLKSLCLVTGQVQDQVLQPDLLQKVLTSCTGLTQLTLDTQWLDDQGLGVLLTHGTSITDLTLGRTSLTTSKADRPCSWRKLSLWNGSLQELAYLPLQAVQQLKCRCHSAAPFLELTLPRDIPPAQLPYLLHQATHNLASCPAWVRAPASELQLHGSAHGLTSDQRVQLLQALAPVAGRHVSRLNLAFVVQLGQAEAEAIASSFAGSFSSLHLSFNTVHDSFLETLAQHYPDLQELGLRCLLMQSTYSSTYDRVSQMMNPRLQPDLLQKVLRGFSALTQLTLDIQKLDDQGLGVLLTCGTSITHMTLGKTSLTTSKADWACSWRKLDLHGALQEFAYLPLKAVQELQVMRHGMKAPLGQLSLPSEDSSDDQLPGLSHQATRNQASFPAAAQLPDLLHQATRNLASCPAWVRAPPSELQLHGNALALTSDQQVRLLQALAPVAGRHVNNLRLDVGMELGQADVEAIASSFAGSLTSLHLDTATLLDCFCGPLVQRFPNLQELCLGYNLMADTMSVPKRRLQDQVLQPGLLHNVLTSCTRLAQLQLSGVWIDDQGLEEVLTHGTSITDITLGKTSLTSSKADWACSWRKLVFCGSLQEFAYLPLRSVQRLQVIRHSVYGLQPYQVKLGQLDLPSDTPIAQLPDLLHQATRNLASCPAWVRAPASELQLHGSAHGLTSDQRVQLLQALAPVAGRHVSKLRIDVGMQLARADVEAMASSFAGSLTSLHLDSATLLDCFWRPLVQHFPNLQELGLGRNVSANVMSVAMYLALFSCCASQGRRATIECFGEPDTQHLRHCVRAWGLQNIRFEREVPKLWE
jgi:hypothetical protein